MHVKLDSYDALFVFLITVASLGVRYWMLFYPHGVVFDEVYFGNFSNFYIKSTYYHDIHPPFSKIVMFALANLSEYDGSIPFNSCPGGWYPNIDYVQLRITPETLSALCFPLIYLCIRFSHFSKTSAIAGSLLGLFDISLGTEGRHILSDGLLHFFSILHVTTLLYTLNIDDYRCKNFYFWLIMTGITLGAACSSKNTAWGLIPMDAFCFIIYFLPTWQYGGLDYFFDLAFYGGMLLGILLTFYILAFSLHLILLPYFGPGVGYLPENQKVHYVQPENGLLANILKRPGLIHRSIVQTIDMHRGNMGITQFHDSQSFPRHWPILGSVAVYFWAREGGEIRCLGNVFSYYFVLIGLIMVLVGYKRPGWWNGIRFIVGYSFCYFPFYLVPRVMYQYHYHIPLLLGCMAFGAFLDMYFPKKLRAVVATICLALALYGFWLWFPYMTGTPKRDEAITIWNRNWIDGDKDHQSRRAERDRLRAEGKLND